MTRIALFSFLYGCLIFSTISCKEDEPINDMNPQEVEYCINTAINLPTAPPSLKEQQIIDSLFGVVQVSKDNLEFYNYAISQGIDSKRYILKGYYCANNGLRIFNKDFVCYFVEPNDGSPLYFQSHQMFSPVDLDNASSMKKEDVIKIYIETLKNDSEYIGISMSKQAIMDGCFDIEFGYYDVNKRMGLPEAKYTKAWLVRPQG
jgi:hypothetical protein